MANFRLRFGSYDFATAFLPVNLGGGFDLAAQGTARRPGAVTSDGRQVPRSLIIRGMWSADTVPAWLAERDAILHYLASLGPQDLWYGRDDRYFKMAQLESWTLTDPAEGRLFGVMGQLPLTFTASRYPEEFGTTTYTPSVTAGGGGSSSLSLAISYGIAGTTVGDAPTLPVWTIEIDTGGTGLLTFNDAAGLQICTLAPFGGSWTSGDVITLNADTKVATLNGSPVVGLYDRLIPRIMVTTTGVQVGVALGGTATLHQLAASYPGRWAA